MTAGDGAVLVPRAGQDAAGARDDFFDSALDSYYPAPEYALWRALELRLLARRVLPRPVLDIGCGDGSFAAALFPAPVDAGCDLDGRALATAARSGAYRLVQRADAGRLPFAAGVFGSVFSNCVLEHIPHYRDVLREAARVMRPGGVLLLTVPSPRFHDHLYMVERYRRRRQPERALQYAARIDRLRAHHYYHSGAEWRDLLEDAGFEQIEVEEYLPPAAARTWSVLEEVFATPWLAGYPLYAFLGSPHLGRLRAVSRALVRLLLGPTLRRLYHLETPAGEGGALCIAARRSAPGAGGS